VWGIYNVLTAGQIVTLTAGVIVLFITLWETATGPLVHGGDYRRKQRELRRKRRVDPDASSSSHETAGHRNMLTRAQSALMTPSGRFRDYGGDRRHLRQQTVSQNIVMTWKLLAAKSKVKKHEERSPLIEDQHHSSNETQAVTDEHDSDDGGLGTVSAMGLQQQQQLSTRTPTFHTAREHNETGEVPPDGYVEMSDLASTSPAVADDATRHRLAVAREYSTDSLTR
jgi:hypothetical protein